ncbi:unnamed protein product [Cuscuta campestris]|uniref:glucan endo-1,3-beta-D-glucosidase n=1 Tax=Cuscuta campestris TaxID=132261 RepID=A0A484NHA3_9ASTE|nr:unnamed protein product [Cuscuta campestris]
MQCSPYVHLMSMHASFIGVNYGQVADNLPATEATAELLQSTSIQKVRLYGSDTAIIKALANTGVGIMIGVANGDIPAMATDPGFSQRWISSNVIPFYPASIITTINVGNEVLYSGDRNLIAQLLPAMKNLQSAIDSVSVLRGKIKVSTVHGMSMLTSSEPPSSGRFDPAITDSLKEILSFNNATGSAFLINPYPFFAYQSDPRPETLAFCLFRPNAGRLDPATNIRYTNMFDAQLDAVRSALDWTGFREVEIVVAETGWPYAGDANEVGPSIDNAKAYVGNLVSHLRSTAGTPLMPGKSVDTYLFALYDEDLKPGPTSERSFGLFYGNSTMIYDAGLLKSSSSNQSPPMSKTAPPPPCSATPPPPQPSSPSKENNKNASSGSSSLLWWCVPKEGVPSVGLQANIDYACAQTYIDCGPIQPGGACFQPNTIASHAAYAMNLVYQNSGRNSWNCDFSRTATLTSNNPSYDECNYPA